MFNEIDLKDPKYLKDYESQIRKLPLDELYEVLDIIKKDKSPERVDIVNKRICELENSNGLSIFEENQLKKLSQLAENYQQDRNVHRKGRLTAEELEEVKKTVEEIYEKHKDVEIIGYGPTDSNGALRPIYESKYNIERGKHIESLGRYQQNYQNTWKWLFVVVGIFSVVFLVVNFCLGEPFFKSR